jgi:hypothetical protein
MGKVFPSETIISSLLMWKLLSTFQVEHVSLLCEIKRNAGLSSWFAFGTRIAK